MQNGIAILKKTDMGTKGVFIDRETLELERLNALTQKRIERAAAERQIEKQIERQNRRNAEKAESKFSAYTKHTIKYIAVRGGIVLATTCAGVCDMIHPDLWSFITFYCTCAVCVKLCAWYWKAVK